MQGNVGEGLTIIIEMNIIKSGNKEGLNEESFDSGR